MADEPEHAIPVHAAFAELTGAVEKALGEHPGPVSERARWLLEALAVVRRGAAEVEIGDLTLGEFDGCLADLHAALFGTTLPCEAECPKCTERYEFALDLATLRRAVSDAAVPFRTDGDGIVTAPSGRRFRLPRVADLGRVGASGWLEALLVEGEPDAEALDDELSAASGVLSQDISAPCPECGAANRVRFDIARYLVETLAGEAPLLWREVHLLARHYGWGLGDILALTRQERRQLAGLIVADMTASTARTRLAS